MLLTSDSLESFLCYAKANPNVACKDWGLFESKINAIAAKGTAHLHIIADFDRTLTKYAHQGQKAVSSHGLLEHSIEQPDIRKALDDVYKKYYPMEIDHSINNAEKVKLMVEWWTIAHNLISSAKVTKPQIKDFIAKTEIHFRELSKEFYELITRLEIPLLIFSAGVGDVIYECFLKERLWTDDMAIISNMMEFENEVCVGFKDPLIHILNKDEAEILQTMHAAKIAHRDNVVISANQILLGDSLGDLQMANGVQHSTKLTVGFLNHDVDNVQIKKNYTDAFDIVLLNDVSMEFMILLISAIAN